LAENIDFGSNLGMSIIISLILGNEVEERPYCESIFRPEHQKVGIACGPHKNEFQMCVMDFDNDFLASTAGKENNQNKINIKLYLAICKMLNKDEELLNNHKLSSNAVNPNEIDLLTFQITNNKCY